MPDDGAVAHLGFGESSPGGADDFVGVFGFIAIDVDLMIEVV